MTKTRIEQLEVGDRVAINTGSVPNRYTVHEVTKITETQITTRPCHAASGASEGTPEGIGGERYNKRTGVRIGDGDSVSLVRRIARNWNWNLMSIEEAERRNKEAEQELKAKLLAVKIKDAPLSKLKTLPVETLQQVIKLLGLDGEE